MAIRDDEISLSRLNGKQWSILGAAVVFCAIGIWQSILPYLAERHYRDGFNFDAGNRFKYAAEELELAVDDAPWETQYIMALGKAYEGLAEQTTDVPTKLEYLNKALNLYFRTIDLDVMNPWQHNRVAAVYMIMADLLPLQRAEYTKKSEDSIRRAAEYDHQNPLFQLNLAYYLHRANRFDEARKYYELVLSMDPNILEAKYNLADIDRREGHLDKTLKGYLEIYAINKDFSNINIAISGTYIQLGRVADAVPYMEAEIKRRPDFVDGLKTLVSMYQTLGNYSRVTELYYQMIMLNPGSKEYYAAFAASAKASGKRAETLAALQQFKVANPNAQVLDELIALLK